MADLICDMLDYNTTVYLEVFGGGFRTLLNKPRHEVEIYNDGSLGLCSFVNLMSREETAQELIRRIYETDYSAEAFRNALTYKEKFDTPVKKQLKKQFIDTIRYLLVKYELIIQSYNNAELKEALHDYEYAISTIAEKCTDKEKIILDRAAENYLESLKVKRKEYNLFETFGDLSDEDSGYLFNYELAVATYICYSQSRDGIGKNWSSVKFKSQEAYQNQMDKLYDVAERLNGVQVFGAEDARVFMLTCNYLNDPHAMFYLDPSYINEDDKNLGGIYNTSFLAPEHECMLDIICNAKSKIIISNYDVRLYNEYLTPERGWKRLEFETTTSLAREGERDRTEVLWYNY